MTDPVLREAAHALRDLGEQPAERPQATRARIMMSLHRKRGQRWRRAGMLAPLGLILAGSSAWAAVFTAFAVVFVTRDEPTPPAPTETVAAPKRTGAVAARSPAMQESIADQEEDEDGAIEVENQPAVTEESAAAPEVPPATRTPAPSLPQRAAAARQRDSVTVQRQGMTASAPAAPEPGEEPGMELYRAAHRAHFVDRDPARALAAWDAYLREAPGGRFAAEARYNRALSLVRLGHHTAAARALQPFADGRYGGYRQPEARALLGELE